MDDRYRANRESGVRRAGARTASARTNTDTARTDARTKSDNSSSRISRIKTDSSDRSVSAHDSPPHEPGRRMIFENDLGKLFAPNPDRCAVTKSIIRAR